MAFNEIVLPQKIQLEEKPRPTFTANLLPNRTKAVTVIRWATPCAGFYFPVWKGPL